MNLIKLVIFAVAMLFGAGLFAQETVTGTGFTTQLIYQRGGYGADSVFGLPVRDTTSKFAAFRNRGRITLNPNDSLIYFHNGARWVAVGEGGGSIDTSLFLKWTDTVSTLATKSDIENSKNFPPYQDRWISQIQGIPTDGVTSVSAYIQPVLDSADILGGLRIHWDIPRTAIDSELRVKSNTIIEGVDNPYVKLLDNVRQPFFINYNIAPGAPMVDSNISIRNFYLDGNAFGNIDSVHGYVTRDNSIITGIFLAGVKRVRLENIVFYQTNAWGVALSNVDYSYVSNLTGIRDYNFVSDIEISGSNWRLGKVPLSMDLINYRGGCEYGYAEDLKSNSPDDAVAINNIQYDSVLLGGVRYFENAPTHDIYINGLFLDSSALGIAIYSSQYEVFNIVVSNIFGKTQNRWGYAGSNSNAIGAIPGYQKGNTRNITIDGVNVELIPTKPNTFDYTVLTNTMFQVDGNINTLNINNVNLNKWDRYITSFQVVNGFNVNQLTVNNYTETHDKDTTLTLPRFALSGTVKNGLFSNVKFSRASTLPQNGKLMDVDTMNSLTLSNVQVFNIDTIARINGVGVGKASFNNITMDSCATSGAVVEVTNAGATVALSQSGLSLGLTQYVVGAGLGVANSRNFGRVSFVSTNNDIVSSTQSYSSNVGHFISPSTSGASAERWFGFANAAGTALQGALSGVWNSGNLTRMGITSSTGLASSDNAQIIMETPGSLANVMRIKTHNIAQFFGTSLQSNTDSLYHFKNANAITRIWSVNMTSGTGAQADFNAVSDASSATFGKYSTAHTTYKTITGNSGFFYNSNGAFAILNDGQNITLTSNALSLAQITLDATGLSLGASTKLKLYNNVAPLNGELLIGHTANGTFEKATLTAGTGISVTNAAGAITITRTNDGTGTISSAGTLALNRDDNYVFSGTTATWTLPAVSGTAWRRFFIKNRGSGNVTINAAAAANEIYTTLATNTYTLTPGSAIILVSDGSFWLVE